jgi:hypothetical protein
MSTNALSRSVAVRVLRATPGRTAAIAVTIGVPTGFAVAAVTADWTGSFGASVAALAITAAIVIVAQSSAEPTSVASVAAWQAAGADAFTATRSRRDALRILGWCSVVVGAIVGFVVGVWVAGAEPNWAMAAVLVVGLALVVFTAAAVAWRTKARRRRLPEVAAVLRYVLYLPCAAFLLWLSVGASTAVRSDLDALFLIPISAGLLVATLILLLPPLRALTLAIARLVPTGRGVAVLTDRHRGRVLVRAVVVTSFAVAAVAAILGSSVAARNQAASAVITEVDGLPRVPANVMALTFPLYEQPWLDPATSNPDSPPAFTPDQVATLRAQYPDSQVVPVNTLVGEKATRATFSCMANTHCGSGFVVADPQLNGVYGHPPLTTELFNYSWVGGEQGNQSARASLSTPEGDQVTTKYVAGAPLPAASWDELNFLQIDPADVPKIGAPTAVRTVFVTRGAPYTPQDRQWLDTFAASAGGDGHAVAMTSEQRSPGFAVGGYGQVPWAPVDPSTRWSITLIAAALALIAVVGTSSVVAIDRWRDNERLEVLGASPTQLRLAAALHTWIELGLTALLAVGLTVALVDAGIGEFNRNATFPAPFTAPWTQIVFLVVVIPLVAMTVAALVARPLHIGSRRTAVATAASTLSVGRVI